MPAVRLDLHPSGTPSRLARLQTRAQWGPDPRSAIRIDARAADVRGFDAAGSAEGSLAAWAATVRRDRAARAGPGGSTAGGASIAAGASHAIAVAARVVAGIVPAAARAGRAVVRTVGRGALAPLRAWHRQHRIARGIAELQGLDAHLLRDLGIEREDIERLARHGGGAGRPMQPRRAGAGRPRAAR